MSIIDSHKSSKTWATGKNAKYVSFGPALKGCPHISKVLAMEVKVQYKFLWVKTTPLGTPVDPEVYIIIAASSLKKNQSYVLIFKFDYKNTCKNFTSEVVLEFRYST